MAGYAMKVDDYHEVFFQARGLTLRGKRWGKGADRKILAMHGWMDNCHSFLPLVEHLGEVDLVAIDLAGHGISDHRSADAAYNIWQDVAEINAILEQLGWQQFILLGHSRGAIIATLYAGALPNNVAQLILLDGFVPIPMGEAQAPEQLANAIRDNKRFATGTKCYYPNFEEALQSRVAGQLTVSREAAEHLAQRGLIETEQGFYWCVDRRLRGASEFKLTKGQVVAFINACQCPINIIVRLDWEKLFKTTLEELPTTAAITLLPIAGSHHLHMDSATVGLVAEQLNQLMTKQS